MPYRLEFATKLKVVRYKDILFDAEGYSFSALLSKDREWVFTR